MTLTGMSTQEVLATMLTENTGVALCDSGGIYGRHWEENQGRDLASFEDAPEAEIVSYGEDEFGWIKIDLFHYLESRVQFDSELDEEFAKFADLPENKNEGWLYLMEEFAESKSDNARSETFNSYNAETLLSQTIQGTVFEMGEDWYVLLQIHGGCDVRGGYTAPHVFRIYTERGAGDWYDLIWGWNSFYIEGGPDYTYSFRDGDWCDAQGNLCDEPDASQIVKKDGKWIHKPSGIEVDVYADNEW